jgi:hypothetical protein
MSIDDRIWVPAGVRNDSNSDYTKYKCGDVMPSQQYTVHQVLLAHANVLIDEQYFFQTEEDARWFWEVGYKRCLYLIGEGPQSMDTTACTCGSTARLKPRVNGEPKQPRVTSLAFSFAKSSRIVRPSIRARDNGRCSVVVGRRGKRPTQLICVRCP